MHVHFRTARLLLRRFTAADVDVLADLDADPAVTRYLTGGRPTPRQVVRDEVLPRFLAEYERDPELAHWAAVEQATGGVVGWFGLPATRPGSRAEAELGYRLRAAAWGRGYATEGSLALVRRAFTELDVDRVVAKTMTVNTASRRVLAKAGLRYVRTFFTEWPDVVEGGELGDVEYAVDRAQWERREAQAGDVPAH